MDWSFYNYLMSLFLVIFSALKYTDTSTVTPAFLSLMFPWYIFFHLFIFYLLISLYLKWFYCYQHIVGSYFLMQYVSLHCLTGIFRLFKFFYYWWDLALACHFVFICFFYFFLVKSIKSRYFLLLVASPTGQNYVNKWSWYKNVMNISKDFLLNI